MLQFWSHNSWKTYVVLCLPLKKCHDGWFQTNNTPSIVFKLTITRQCRLELTKHPVYNSATLQNAPDRGNTGDVCWHNDAASSQIHHPCLYQTYNMGQKSDFWMITVSSDYVPTKTPFTASFCWSNLYIWVGTVLKVGAAKKVLAFVRRTICSREFKRAICGAPQQRKN